MITDKMIPNIEQRMSAWLGIQEQLLKERPPEPRPAITISRQYGCDGYPLAETLKQMLEEKTGDLWTIFDKALIERVSNDTGLSERLLSTLGDVSKPLDEIMGTLMPKWKTHTEAYRLLARQVIALANQGNVIIVGRGGAFLTQRFPNCFHFRLVAPLEYRIQSIRQRLNIPYAEAKTMVIENEKARDRFIESLLNCSIDDPHYYHCVFNTGKSKIPSIARCILNLTFDPDPASLHRSQKAQP
jgi:cytidylate kinase